MVAPAIQSREEWLAERKSYVGASEVAAICKLSSYDTPRKVWMCKKGLLEVPESLAMKMGNALEPLAASEFAFYMGIKETDLLPTRLVRHDRYPHFAANPDRFWESPDGLATVQLKTCGEYASGDFGQSGTDEVKDEYLVQCAWEMAVSKAKVGYLAVIIGNRDFRVFRFTWTPTMKAIVQRAFEDVRDWWEDHYLADVPPPLTGRDADREIITDAYVDPHDEILAQRPEIDDLLGGWRELEKLVEEGTLEIERRKNILRETIGNAAGIQTALGIATWKANINAVRSLRYKQLFKGVMV